MPERATVAQVAQIGVETTPGTAVAANKALQALQIAASPQIETNRFRPQGYKADTVLAIGKDWTEADLSGIPTYDELVYLLCSLLVNVTPSTTGTTGKLWDFSPNATSEDTIKTYTVEIGSAVRAHKFPYGLVNALGLTYNRDGIDLSGSMLGQNITDGITLTASPTALTLQPILAKDTSVYLDTTAAGLGTTKLLRVLEAELSIGDRFGPVWVLNAANASFAVHVETIPDLTIRLLVEADSSGMALLTALRANSKQFVRVETVGPVIGAGPATYKSTLDVCCIWEETGGFDDNDGLYAFEVTGRIAYDSTWAKYMRWQVINALASL